MEMWEIVRNYVQENGFIKNVLADKCGMDHQKFYRILSGNQNMTVEEYEMICRQGLGLDPAHFFKLKFSKTENTRTA